MAEPEYNEAIVQCLRIAYRRGRAVREARERERQAAGALAEDELTDIDEPEEPKSRLDLLIERLKREARDAINSETDSEQ